MEVTAALIHLTSYKKVALNGGTHTQNPQCTPKEKNQEKVGQVNETAK